MARDQQSLALVVSGCDRLPNRPLEESCTLQPHASPSSQGRHQIGLSALELVEQQLTEQMVVAIPLPLLVQGNHEQVGAGELAQEHSRILPACHRVAERTRHRPQDRGLEQKLPHFLGEASQNLLSQQTDDVTVGAPERLDKGVLVLLVLQGEGGEVDPRRPPFGPLEQNREVVRADVQSHLLVQQALGFLLCEGQLLGAYLAHLSPGPQPPQVQGWVGPARDDEVNVLGEVLHKKGHRFMRVHLGYGLVVIEHQYNLIGQLDELVYERGKRGSHEPLPHGTHSNKSIGSEVLRFWHNLAQRLYYVSPQPDRIVVLLFEGDPSEGHLGFFYVPPGSQERRLPGAGRGAHDSYLEVQGVSEELEQPATDHVLGARQRRPQLGLEYDPGRINAWVARGLDNSLLCLLVNFDNIILFHKQAAEVCALGQYVS